ncbi:hypothetical protein BH10PLA2_BH10PLA2_34400 [soil metagenome]
MANNDISPQVVWWLTCIVGFIVYFLPTFVASCRERSNTGAIFCLNLLLGATVIGWGVAFVWAVSIPAGFFSEKGKDIKLDAVRATPEFLRAIRWGVLPHIVFFVLLDIACSFVAYFVPHTNAKWIAGGLIVCSSLAAAVVLVELAFIHLVRVGSPAKIGSRGLFDCVYCQKELKVMPGKRSHKQCTGCGGIHQLEWSWSELRFSPEQGAYSQLSNSSWI